MKNRTLILLITILISQFSRSQSDTLNQTDSNFQRKGWWIVYLDKDLALTKDTTEAVYYKFSYFDGKFDYFNMGRIGTRKNPVIAPSTLISKSEIEPLDGEYKANYTNGQARFVLIAKNGKLIEYKEYYKDGTLKTRFDYSESCGDTPFHYCIYQFTKNGELKYKGTIQSPKK